jgi:putative transposase
MGQEILNALENSSVTENLIRFYGQCHLHFITCSCYQRRPLLDTPQKRRIFLRTLNEVRNLYRFALVGYVVMPEHFHLLISEPEIDNPSTVCQILKQRTAHRLRTEGEALKHPLWMHRFYDFNIWTQRKRIEKLNYIHMNPVKRSLVPQPELWPWSSYRFYQYGEQIECTPNPASPRVLRPPFPEPGKSGAPGKDKIVEP